MTIRLLKYSEIKDIQNYLKKNWRSSILDKDTEFFKWTYYRNNPKNEIVDFVVEIDDSSNSILSCLGFIQTKNFFNDSEDLPNTVWLTNWKTISKKVLAGIKILKFLESNINYEMIGTIGCNVMARDIYKALGYKTGKMRRFCAINLKKNHFDLISKDTLHKIRKIYKNIDINPLDKRDKDKTKIFKIKNFKSFQEPLSEKEINISLPYKNINYFVNRYLNHPIFKYEIYCLKGNNKIMFLAVRKCFKNKSFALRIVDILGDINFLFSNSEELLRVLFLDNPEYIDFYFHSSFQVNTNSYAGLIETSNNKELIIPGYFDPFVESSPEIYFAYKTASRFLGNEIFFKGDCDQDRPS